MLAKSPRVRVLDGVMATLLAADLPAILADQLLAMGDGVTPAPLTLRWVRNRYTTIEERPCIAVAFVSDEPADRQDQYAAAGEAVRELGIDIIADIEVPTEVEVEEGGASDTARLEILSHFVDQPVKALRDSFIDPAGAPTPLSNLAHWIEDLGVQEDEDLGDEDGRLVYRLNVLYRVRSDDHTVLLTTE